MFQTSAVRAVGILAATLSIAACVQQPPRGPNPLSIEYRTGMGVAAVQIVNTDRYPDLNPILLAALNSGLADLNGARRARLEVFIDHFELVGTGQTMLVGAADILAATTVVRDVTTGAVLAEYPITLARVRSGLLGLAIRGSDEQTRRTLSEDLAQELRKEIQRAE